jgi:hypothetical protein
VYKGNYHHLWATTDAEEKKAFEDFVDQMMEVRRLYPVCIFIILHLMNLPL